MKAVLSTTFDDNYLFFLPIVTWAWNKLGIDVICFEPRYVRSGKEADKLGIVIHAIWKNNLQIARIRFDCPENKTATYAQCARLYGATQPLMDDNEILVTGDIDMAVFQKEFFKLIDNDMVHIVGADLVPDYQYPICYIAMPAEKWRNVMDIGLGETHQHKLDQLLGDLDCEHFRGNYWAKDQETIYNHIIRSGQMLFKLYRAKPGTQFAMRRADRDGWPVQIPTDIIDAHLPRPGYVYDNFAKILNLFQTMYPDDNFDWMVEYRNEYVKHI